MVHASNKYPYSIHVKWTMLLPFWIVLLGMEEFNLRCATNRVGVWAVSAAVASMGDGRGVDEHGFDGNNTRFDHA
jgi:hypothetical protein